MQWLVVALSVVALVPAFAKNTESDVQSHLIHTKGDPLRFVVGRRTVRASSIRLDHVDLTASYQLSISSIHNIAGKRQPESEQKSVYYRIEKGDHESDYQFIPQNGQGLKFKFLALLNRLELSAIATPEARWLEDNGDFRLIHYSSIKDGSGHSILVYFDHDGHQSLVSYSFIKVHVPAVNLVSSSEPYSYAFGPGVKVGWSAAQQIELDFCDQDAPAYMYADFTAQLGKWSELLANRLKITPNRTSDCPPFSDLNTKTLTFIDGWVESPGPQSGLFGATLLTMDISRGRILDGDIFIFKQELQEVLDHTEAGHTVFEAEAQVSDKFRKDFGKIVLHELGHFVGLNHIFDGRPSIMSYDDIYEIQDYDRAAVHSLYPTLSIP